MLTSNTIRFGTDVFAFNKQSLLTSKVPWNTANQTSVEGFTISGSQPTGTERRLVFKVDGKLYKFTDGVPVEYTGAGEFDDIIAGGNTVDELLAITSIPSWVNKQIYPIIALQAPVEATALPSIKIALKVRASTDLYERTVETAEYTLAADGAGAIPRIADIVASTTCTGGATCTVTCRMKLADGTWTNYVPLIDTKNKECLAVQFKIVYRVTEIGGADSAKLNNITIKHNMGATAVSGDTADLYSVVQNYSVPLQVCQIIVKHKPLYDSEIHAYVNFMAPPKVRERISLGVSNGTRQQFALGVDGVKDTGINQNTLKVYVDGVPLNNFGYNMEVSEVTVDAENGQAISASYEYGHEVEEWIEMEQAVRSQPYTDDGTYMSKFTYTLPDDMTEDKCISNIRLKLFRPSGTVRNEVLGKGTGVVQQFRLPHAAKQDTIVVNGEWSYDDNTQILTVVAAKNSNVTVSYDYLGEGITLLSFVAAWIAAV